MINPLYVANTILLKAHEENIDISPMKLQKLIYIFYKKNLQNNNEKLFNDKFEVWKYGPVLSSVYEYFKPFRSKPITNYFMDTDNTFTTLDLSSNKNVKNAFDDMWKVYKHFDGVYLSMLTHLEGTAWDKAKNQNKDFLEDNDIIQEFDYESKF